MLHAIFSVLLAGTGKRTVATEGWLVMMSAIASSAVSESLFCLQAWLILIGVLHT